MARKLKTYQTSLGFFDQAIAAPSMKAALDAWGADSNLFHQGAAKESHDPDVVAATMAKPGVVLKRPVGTDRPFSEHAKLPTDLGGTGPTKAARKPKGPRPKGLRLAPSTRRRNERPLSPTNESRSVSSVNGRRKRPPRTVNGVSRPSTRRRLRWIRPSRSTGSGPPSSRPRSRLSRRDCKPKKPAGIRIRSDWKLRCGAREVSLWPYPRVQASGPFKRSMFRNRFHPDGLASRFRWMPSSGREPTETLLRQAACGAKLPFTRMPVLGTGRTLAMGRRMSVWTRGGP
jgi:hypothetical protein